MPRHRDGSRRVGVARRLERSGAFGQGADEGANMRVARAIGVDGIDLKARDRLRRAVTKHDEGARLSVTYDHACGLRADLGEQPLCVGRDLRRPGDCGCFRAVAAQPGGTREHTRKDGNRYFRHDWRRIEDEGKSCGDRLDPVGKRLAASGVAEGVAGSENPIAGLELDVRKCILVQHPFGTRP